MMRIDGQVWIAIKCAELLLKLRSTSEMQKKEATILGIEF